MKNLFNFLVEFLYKLYKHFTDFNINTCKFNKINLNDY